MVSLNTSTYWYTHIVYTYFDLMIYMYLHTHTHIYTHTHITTGMVPSHDMSVSGHSPPTFLTGTLRSTAIS